MPSDHDFLRLTEKIGQCDVLVFLGHGVFHESESGKLLSGLVLSERSSLLSDVLNSIWNDRAPLLMITTACHSARSTTLRAELTDPGIGFAQAALATGVRSFLGAGRQLPNTKSTAAFVQFVCRHLLEGRVISQAVLEARRECLKKFGQEDLSWALFTLFGDPFTRLAVTTGDTEWHQERSAHA
jgi:CHAT domain-containing protein